MPEDDFTPDVAAPEEGTPAIPAGEPAEPAGEVLADDRLPPDVEDETTPTTEPTPAAGSGGKFDKLLAKYGGDRDKMADAYFEQANSMSDLNRKFDALLEKMDSPQQATPEELQRQIADDPDIKEIASDLSSIDAEVKGFVQYDKQLIEQFGQLELKVKEVQAQVQYAPDAETKQGLERKLAELVREQRDVQRDWNNNKKDILRSQRALDKGIREYRAAEARAKTKLDQAKKQELDNRIAGDVTRRDFVGAVRAEAGNYGIALESQTYGLLHQSIRDRLVNYLKGLGPEAEGIDIPEAVGVLFKEYADAMNLKKGFKTVSRQKAAITQAKPLQVQPQPRREGSPVPQKGLSRQQISMAWKDRAKRMLG